MGMMPKGFLTPFNEISIVVCAPSTLSSLGLPLSAVQAALGEVSGGGASVSAIAAVFRGAALLLLCSARPRGPVRPKRAAYMLLYSAALPFAAQPFDAHRLLCARWLLYGATGCLFALPSRLAAPLSRALNAEVILVSH